MQKGSKHKINQIGVGEMERRPKSVAHSFLMGIQEVYHYIGETGRAR
jgi:hypothetical protein